MASLTRLLLPAFRTGFDPAGVQTLTSAIYDILGAYGIIRVDYIITEGGKNQSAGGEYHPRNDCHQLYSPAGSCCRNGDEGCNDRYYRKQV